MINLECCTCGMVFGVSDFWQQNRRKTKQEFYCPNGHQQSYSESPEDKMRRERDKAIQDQARLTDENAAKDREIAKLKRRSAAGVCPCCTRTFTNMARHMKTKHPEILRDNVVKLKSKSV